MEPENLLRYEVEILYNKHFQAEALEALKLK